MNVTGKVIWITGASSGIGEALAYALASKKAKLILSGRNLEALEQVKEKCNSADVVLLPFDLSHFDLSKSTVYKALQFFGSIDVLINNAGITADKLMLKMTMDDFERVLKINLTGAFNMTQAVLKPMTKARQGAIINMTSVVGLMGNVGQANYAASKAGLIGLTKSVAREVASRNIRVNAIAPGFIESDMTAVLSDKVKDAMKAQIPMKRFGSVEEIATAALFVATQEYITGQTIAIDGGMVMQ